MNTLITLRGSPMLTTKIWSAWSAKTVIFECGPVASDIICRKDRERFVVFGVDHLLGISSDDAGASNLGGIRPGVSFRKQSIVTGSFHPQGGEVFEGAEEWRSKRASIRYRQESGENRGLCQQHQMGAAAGKDRAAGRYNSFWVPD